MTKLGFDRLVAAARLPGSKMVPAVSALLSLLTLKLLDKERRSHIGDFDFDPALGLFAGLNVLPKKSFATDYSYRTTGDHHRKLLEGWVRALGPILFPEPEGFSLDFHPIPYRGEPSGLENHYLPRRGVAGPSVLAFFALEQKSRVLCYGDANVTRADHQCQAMRFVEFWNTVTGEDPQWLYLDSKVADYPELSRLNERKVNFVTIRRRGPAILRRLNNVPSMQWQKALIDIPKRRHQNIRYLDETIRLQGYDGPIRQVPVTGLGRENPTLFLANNFDATPRQLVFRYAGRNRIEDGLGISVNFFHLDCLASEVRLNVDLDAALTVLANGCYRWLGQRLRGFDAAAPKQLFRRFVELAGAISVDSKHIVVAFDKRSHNPILREAALDKNSKPIPWLGNRTIRFTYP